MSEYATRPLRATAVGPLQHSPLRVQDLPFSLAAASPKKTRPPQNQMKPSGKIESAGHQGSSFIPRHGPRTGGASSRPDLLLRAAEKEI